MPRRRRMSAAKRGGAKPASRGRLVATVASAVTRKLGTRNTAWRSKRPTGLAVAVASAVSAKLGASGAKPGKKRTRLSHPAAKPRRLGPRGPKRGAKGGLPQAVASAVARRLGAPKAKSAGRKPMRSMRRRAPLAVAVASAVSSKLRQGRRQARR